MSLGPDSTLGRLTFIETSLRSMADTVADVISKLRVDSGETPFESDVDVELPAAIDDEEEPW